MMPIPPDSPLSVRLGARFGPEFVGSLLAAALLIAVSVVLLTNGGGQPGGLPRSPSGGNVSPGSPGSPGSSPSEPAATATPDVATATVVLQIVDRLIDERTALATAVSPRNPDVQAIAERLRGVNADLIALDLPVAELARSHTAIGQQIEAVSVATRQAVADTQRASLANIKAYKSGGAAVVKVMEPLVALRADLAALVIVPTAAPPTAAPATPAATAAEASQPIPSGTTP